MVVVLVDFNFVFIIKIRHIQWSFVVDTDDPVNIELSGRAAAGGCGCGCVAVAVVATGLYGNSGVGDLILSESVCSSIIGPLGVLLNIELTFHHQRLI